LTFYFDITAFVSSVTGTGLSDVRLFLRHSGKSEFHQLLLCFKERLFVMNLLK